MGREVEVEVGIAGIAGIVGNIVVDKISGIVVVDVYQHAAAISRLQKASN